MRRDGYLGKKALTYEGEDVLLELVQSGALESRVHPKLPKGSKIPYPMNLQVYYVEEKIRKTDATKDETTLQESSSVDAEKHEGWLKEFHTAKMELKPSRSSAGPDRAGKISNAGDTASTLNEAPSEGNQSTTQGTHAYAEKTKIAIKDLRKNVNAGDRFKKGARTNPCLEQQKRKHKEQQN